MDVIIKQYSDMGVTVKMFVCSYCNKELEPEIENGIVKSLQCSKCHSCWELQEV